MARAKNTMAALGESTKAVPYLERGVAISKSGFADNYPACAARLGQAYAAEAEAWRGRLRLAGDQAPIQPSATSRLPA